MKWIAAIFLSAWMILCGNALAMENVNQVKADEWSAVLENGIIVIYDASGALMTEIEYAPDPYDVPMLITDDLNFDGKNDLTVIADMGVVNSRWSVWLRKGDEGKMR